MGRPRLGAAKRTNITVRISHQERTSLAELCHLLASSESAVIRMALDLLSRQVQADRLGASNPPTESPPNAKDL